MSVLLATAVARHHGANEVLRGVDLRVEDGEKVGLVGRNGGGKSTLLRLITGEERPDGGSVVVPRGVTVGYVPQRAEFDAGVIAFDHVEGGLAETRAVAAELEAVHERMATTEGAELERVLERYSELTHRMDHLDGWHTEQRVQEVLSGIGLAESLWRREARTLSGGEKARVALARQLVRRPDLLLLDEPTNHLDLDGIEWLEDYLRELAGAVLLVSHDRRLLERIPNAILELERGKLIRYKGNYSRYVVQKQERYDADLRAYEQQADELRKEQAFIKKHMGSQRTGEAKGRQKRLQRVERLERPFNDVRRPVLRFREVPRSGEVLVEAHDLAYGYDGVPLQQGVELRLGRGERVGIVGPNGSGKSSLTKVLAGRLAPLGGVVERGHNAVCGFYDQETSDLDPTATPLQTLRRDHPTRDEVELRSHLALFLFRGEEVDLPVSGLSGGERARLTLARMVLQQPTWLALDEPTNHLDLAARTALEEMLAAYPGAIVCISHDREFLDNLCGRIVEITPAGVRDFRGNYSDWRAAVTAEHAAADAERSERDRVRREQERKREEAEARKRAEAERKGGRAKKADKGREKAPRNPWKLERLEKEIIALEEEREGLNAALATEEVYRDAERVREAQTRLAEIERDLEEKNSLWESWA